MNRGKVTDRTLKPINGNVKPKDRCSVTSQQESRMAVNPMVRTNRRTGNDARFITKMSCTARTKKDTIDPSSAAKIITIDKFTQKI